MDSALTLTEIPTSYYLSTGEEGGEEGRPAIDAADGHVVVMPGRGNMKDRLLEVLGVAPEADEAVEMPATSRIGLHREAIASWCAIGPEQRSATRWLTLTFRLRPCFPSRK